MRRKGWLLGQLYAGHKGKRAEGQLGVSCLSGKDGSWRVETGSLFLHFLRCVPVATCRGDAWIAGRGRGVGGESEVTDQRFGLWW